MVALLRILVIGTLITLVAVGAILGFIGHEGQRAAAAPPDESIDVAGLTYTNAGARPLDERGDQDTLRALPADERRSDRDTIVYGVFVSIANNGARPAGMARRYELLDARGRTMAPVPLDPASPFAYRLARFDLANGPLTLRVFDPTGRTQPADIVVQV